MQLTSDEWGLHGIMQLQHVSALTSLTQPGTVQLTRSWCPVPFCHAVHGMLLIMSQRGFAQREGYVCSNLMHACYISHVIKCLSPVRSMVQAHSRLMQYG